VGTGASNFNDKIFSQWSSTTNSTYLSFKNFPSPQLSHSHETVIS